MIDEISKNLQSKKLVIGTDRTIKSLKLGKLKKVFASANVPADLMADLEHYTNIAKTELVKLDVPSDDLGTLCKKPFSISVLGLLK
jgi:large subunit ribosomal protein L30e